MTLKYEILKRIVKAVNIKKRWTGMSTEELLEQRRRANAKNRIPELKDSRRALSGWTYFVGRAVTAGAYP